MSQRGNSRFVSPAAAFFPAYSPIEQIEAWAVLGGMPYYLQTFSDVEDIFAQFASYAFEETAREYVTRLARAGELPFLPERIGAWWERGEEIDVVAISDTEGAMLVGECKWWVNPVGLNVLVDLKRKARTLGASGKWPKVSYALFAKVGFTPDLQTVAASEGVRLVQAAELVEGVTS